MADQHRLDLAGLNPEPADLHLGVGAAKKIQFAIPTPAGEVAGAVHPAPRRTEGVRHKPLRCQPRTPDVSPRKPCTRNVELSDGADRYRLQAGIQHIGARARVLIPSTDERVALRR